MPEITLSPEQSQEISTVYRLIETRYDQVAGKIGLTCASCPDNCCDSYFLHYTYSEWAFLWQGLRALEQAKRERICDQAREYVEQSDRILARGERPQLMCPLNDQGRCTLYGHRLMICRLHGIPSAMTRPDGQLLRFPGCFRCQEIVRDTFEENKEPPFMDRTPLLARIATLESELLGGRRHLYTKVKLTIAGMIAKGPPQVDKPFCQR